MKQFLAAFKPMLIDSIATLGFLAVILLTGRLAPAVALGMALGTAQMGLAMARRQPIPPLQLLNFLMVMLSGAASLITNNPRFVMLKPSVFYAITGMVLLKRGWMIRYLPQEAKPLLSDIAIILGYAWAGLMLASAVLNIAVALHCGIREWAVIMSVFAGVSKTVLFAINYGAMWFIGKRRKARMAGFTDGQIAGETSTGPDNNVQAASYQANSVPS